MKNVDLSNKRILYIGPVHFHYDKSIINKLVNLNAKVDACEIYPFINNLYFRIINKLRMPNAQAYKRNFYDQMLKQKDYDYVLVRTGDQLETYFLKKLRDVNPNAKFINYHWDSIRPEYDYTHIIKFFDKVYSFDYNDCQTYSELTYLPLFYLNIYDEFRQKKLNSFGQKKIDVLFIGSWRNMERYNLVKLIENICSATQLQFYYYLQLSIIRQIQSVKNGIIPKEAKFKRLSHKDILDLFAVTNTIIDLPSSFQTGLTIRTFETLGSGKKLITTNKNILKEPFYNPDYIDLIDLTNIKLNIDFIKSVPTTSIEDQIKNYSIDNFIDRLFQ